ncbi:hypothetical protein PRLR6025_27660 [Prevotella lacticifex]|uniref:hypothetical protein n=1 Tax=Prevotella lacticifex TaxID=2854755 RepID=UPI001CC5064D|nr:MULTISPECIES: hypothetical protein [Prevotella]MDD6854365.1 hypothetical protein [Prevotella sp.]GJG69297.1 hypothetical protein PRLR6025_27660 [Prevotella lacticifex]
MKRKILALTFAMAIVVGANAQSTSTYTPITQNDSDVAAVTNENNLKLNDEYLKWQSKYEEVGTEINDVAAQIDQETAKRGYPKKKTVKQKIALVEQYIQLLEYERDNPSIFPMDLDKGKIERKIAQWQEHLDGLNKLVKKI